MEKNGCFNCHEVSYKIIGPAYKQVAARYKDDKGAEAKLINKIRMGGAGTWGQVSMPSHPKLSDAELKMMVAWILSLNIEQQRFPYP